MKKIILCTLIIVICIGGSFVFFFHSQKKEDKKNTFQEEKDPIVEQLEKMTLEEKIGQMIFIAYRSMDDEQGFFEEMATYQPGGFILFKENISSYQEVKEFNNHLQSLSKIPLFIGTDQEGGRVQRFGLLKDQNFTIIPSMEQVGLTNDPSIAKEIGYILGSELATLGINVDFAPDLDINSNPQNTVIGDRSFGSTKELVTSMGLSLAEGLKNSGVIPVYKHFPGHGDTYEDSHLDFANIYKTKEQLFQTELYPFSQAAKEDDAMIMVGHLSLPNVIGDQTPASLSPTIIQMLKNNLGFQGVVISDALNMGALTNHYSEEEIITGAIASGIDILLMPSSLSNTVTVIQQAIQNGKMTEERINESVLKILRLKEKYHILNGVQEKTLTPDEWQAHQNYIHEHF